MPQDKRERIDPSSTRIFLIRAVDGPGFPGRVLVGGYHLACHSRASQEAYNIVKLDRKSQLLRSYWVLHKRYVEVLGEFVTDNNKK